MSARHSISLLYTSKRGMPTRFDVPCRASYYKLTRSRLLLYAINFQGTAKLSVTAHVIQIRIKMLLRPFRHSLPTIVSLCGLVSTTPLPEGSQDLEKCYQCDDYIPSGVYQTPSTTAIIGCYQAPTGISLFF